MKITFICYMTDASLRVKAEEESRAACVRKAAMNQPYVQQPFQMQMQMPMPAPVMARQPQRSVGMIVGGSILLFLSLCAAGLFFYNLHDYLTVEDRFMSDPVLSRGGRWLVNIVMEADLRRMTIFGAISAVFGIPGMILGGLGLRKK